MDRPRTILTCIVAIWLLSMADLWLTMKHLTPDSEMNPLAAPLLSHAWQIVTFKLTATVMGTGSIVAARRKPVAMFAAVTVAGVYVAVAAWWAYVLTATV